MQLAVPKPVLGPELRATVVLALPLVAGQLATMGMTVAEVILAGHLSAHVLGVVALGSALFNIANLAVLGVNAAVAPSVAQLQGARRRGEVGALFRQALAIAFVLGVALAVLVYVAGPPLARQFGFAPALAEDVGDFLRANAAAAVTLSLFYCCRGVSEGLSVSWPTMVSGLFGLAVLVPVGYVLMYGAAGAPPLGASGAAYASVVASAAQAGGLALWLRFSGRYQGIGWRSGSRRLDPAAMRGLARIGVPMAVSLLLETSLFSAAGLAIGRFGDAATAAHQIAINVASLTFMVPLGISIATTVRVGNAAGRGDAAGVRRAGMIGIGLALGVQAVAGVAILAAPGAIAAIYTSQPEVIAVAIVLLQLAGVFQLSDGLQAAASGTLRGLKDTRVPMVVTALAYWGVGLPLALLLAFTAGMGPAGM